MSDFGIDVESAKRHYLSQWNHCPGKQLVAVDSHIACPCGEKFKWEGNLGDTVALALSLEWLSPNGDTAESNRPATESETDQLGMF
jgi:hypothetical protein